MPRKSGLVLDVRVGESLLISGPAKVDLVHKSGTFARLRVLAEPEVRIEKVPADASADVSKGREISHQA